MKTIVVDDIQYDIEVKIWETSVYGDKRKGNQFHFMVEHPDLVEMGIIEYDESISRLETKKRKFFKDLFNFIALEDLHIHYNSMKTSYVREEKTLPRSAEVVWSHQQATWRLIDNNTKKVIKPYGIYNNDRKIMVIVTITNDNIKRLEKIFQCESRIKQYEEAIQLNLRSIDNHNVLIAEKYKLIEETKNEIENIKKGYSQNKPV
jgi:hypothetical protein